jgi:hypothetical protein
MRPSVVSALLARAIAHREPVMLVGAPGVGKSDLVSQAADEAGVDLLVSHPVVSDPTDPKGLPSRSPDGTHAEFLPFGDLWQALRCEAPLVWFLDDLGQAPPAVQAAFMQLLLARRVNGHALPEWVSFVAATNRREDRVGVMSILEPVKSRFATIVHLEPNVEDWIAWALGAGLSMETIAFVRFRPAFLTDWRPTPDIVNGPCPRTIAAADRVWQWGLPRDLLHEAITGAAGEAYATEFLGFIQVWQELPDVNQVLADPMGSPVPDSVAARYAVCGALARKASQQTIQAITRYAGRLPVEFGVVLVADAARLSPEVCRTRAYVQWQADHDAILV